MAVISKSDASTQLMDHLDMLREVGSLADVILVCGDKEIPAHRIILSGASEYFKNLFLRDCDESKNGRVDLPTIESEEMDAILTFLYTGRFKAIEDNYLLARILTASRVLEINSLAEWCFKKLVTGLSCCAFLDTYNLAELYKDDKLFGKVATFLVQHFAEISKCNEFLKLSNCQLKRIVEQLDPMECYTDDIISALLRWAETVDGNAEDKKAEDGNEGREKTLLQIVTDLDLQLLSTELLTRFLRQKNVKKNYHLYVLLAGEATSRMLLMADIPCKHAEIDQHKLFVIGKQERKQQVYRMYDIALNEWTIPVVIPFRLAKGMSIAWYDGHVYVFGGRYKEGDWRPSTKFIKYYPSNNTIASFRNLDMPVLFPGTIVLGDSIYIVNAWKTSTSVPSLQRYSPLTDTCETIAHLYPFRPWPWQVFPYAQHLHLLCSLTDRNVIERYDPQIDVWTVITTIPRKIDACRTAICGKKLYLVPTRSPSRYLLYDFSSNAWQSKEFTESPNNVYYMTSISEKGKRALFAIDVNCTLHIYDANAHQWFRGSHPSLKPASSHHIVLI